MPIYVNSSQSPFLDAKYFCIKFCRLFSAIYSTEPKTRNGEIKRRTENRNGHDQKKLSRCELVESIVKKKKKYTAGRSREEAWQVLSGSERVNRTRICVAGNGENTQLWYIQPDDVVFIQNLILYRNILRLFLLTVLPVCFELFACILPCRNKRILID